jgi:hypothetical protein
MKSSKIQPYLKITASLVGCFSGEGYEVTLFTHEEPNYVRIVRTLGVVPTPSEDSVYIISSNSASLFVNSVLSIVSKPQLLLGGRSTTIYSVDVLFLNLASIATISTKSSEMTQSELDETANDSGIDDSLRAKINELLILGYHNWAHELFKLTESFVSEVCRNVET